MSNLKDLVETVTQFFCRRIPAAREGGPFNKPKITAMFDEARYCHKLTVNSDISAVYATVVEELVAQWPLYDAPKLLFLALADNIRVNREHLTFARSEYDSINEYQDLELYLCDQQRNEFRETFLSISNVAKQSSNWVRFKAYILLAELHEKRQRLPSDRFSDELERTMLRPGGVDKMVACLTLENITDDVCTTQASVSRLLNRELNFEQITNCDVAVLASGIQTRPEIANTVVRLISEKVEQKCDVATLENVATFTGNIITSSNFSDQAAFLNRLDSVFSQGSFAQSEFMNLLVVFLKLNPPKCI